MAIIWVSTPDGTGLTYGVVPEFRDPFDAELRCMAGEIRLPVGDITKGHVHLNTPKRKERFAPLTPEAYVFQITSDYDEIWFQRGRGSLLLVRRTHRRAAVLSLTLEEDTYGIITAFPLERDHNPRRRREARIWAKV